MDPTTSGRIRADFDKIARLAEPGASGTDRYDRFLISLVPSAATRILDVGCGLGRLTWALASGDREVVGIDLSPAMLERARTAGGNGPVSFHQGDFLELALEERSFDCIVSAAALHHMPADVALPRMVALLRPGGRLVLQDLRRDAGFADSLKACVALAHSMGERFLRTGRARSKRQLRKAWDRRGVSETYLSLEEAHALARKYLPGATVLNHWLWRYTIVWDRPQTVTAREEQSPPKLREG